MIAKRSCGGGVLGNQSRPPGIPQPVLRAERAKVEAEARR
jgi:hypothetical protein